MSLGIMGSNKFQKCILLRRQKSEDLISKIILTLIFIHHLLGQMSANPEESLEVVQEEEDIDRTIAMLTHAIIGDLILTEKEAADIQEEVDLDLQEMTVDQMMSRKADALGVEKEAT
jgi:hypothetical protein